MRRLRVTMGPIVILALIAVFLAGGCRSWRAPGEVIDLGPLLADAALGAPDSGARPALDPGTDVPLVFTPSLDRPPGSFSVATLGNDALELDRAGVTFLLAASQGLPSAKLRAEIVKAGSGEPPEGLEPGVSLAHTLLGPDRRGWLTGASTFGALRYPSVQSGIDLVYSANSRSLHSSYRVAPGADPHFIRLRLPGLRVALPNTATGRLHLEVADESGRRRGLTFLPPRVVQGGRALTANYVVEGDTVALVVDGFERALGLTADFEIAFGEVTQDYDAQIDGTGGCVVVRRVASPVHPESSDVLVVRLDREGQLLSTTRVGGRGNDVPLGVAVAADGSLYVTGKTNSQDFPLVRPVQSVNHGGYDAFILQLDPTGKLLLASTYWGGLGDDAGEALSVEAGGSTLLAGRGCLDCARAPADRIGFVTLFPRRVDGERRANYFLARLNTSLDRLFAFERFSAPRLRGRLAVWRGSFGVPVVGIYSQLSLPCNPGTFQTYQMSQLGDLAFDQDDYVNPNTPGNPLNPTATGWGYHALRWKAISNPLISYSNSAATNVPVHSVACNLSEVQLNNAEATSSVFATDPGGSWHCYPHTTQEGLALTAAFYMHRFASPVYARIQFWNSLGSQWVHFPLAIEQVTFCAVGPNPPPKPLHEQCNFDNINPTMINSFCANWTGGHYQLETMSGRSWGQSYLVYYAPSVTLQPDYGQPWYNKWYLPGDYVGDPPAGQGPLAPYLDDAARQLSAALLTQQEVEVTLHPIGGPSRSATLTRLVRPLDLDRESAPVD